MRDRSVTPDHGWVTVGGSAAPTATATATAAGAAPVRHLYRRPDRGIAGGVATGIAEHIGVSTRVVRIAFLLLGAAGGLGVALYGAVPHRAADRA